MFHYTSNKIKKCNGRWWNWTPPLPVLVIIRRNAEAISYRFSRTFLCKGIASCLAMTKMWSCNKRDKNSSNRSFHLSAYLLIFILSCILGCKKPYEPEVITRTNNFLVVDGYINTSFNGVTTIRLSRTRSIGDTATGFLPESKASINIESSAGTSYPLLESSTGVYQSNPLALNTNNTYRLNISTANGSQYQSELVTVKPSPPIDSITWEQKGDVTIYANTHDPANNTRYYRWDFDETWQYTAQYETFTGVTNHLIYYRDSTNMIYNCWTDSGSATIVLGTSAALSEDVINRAPLTTIVQNNKRIGVRYSILVRQYALTREAYEYWEIIQKNTQRTGSLFDLQPSQLHGNIYPVTNKNEPVIGFISAGSVKQKRIFIKHNEVTDWHVIGFSGVPCDLKGIPLNPSNYLIFDYPDTSYAPYYFVTGGIIISRKECFDCRLGGGINKKPVFW